MPRLRPRVHLHISVGPIVLIISIVSKYSIYPNVLYVQMSFFFSKYLWCPHIYCIQIFILSKCSLYPYIDSIQLFIWPEYLFDPNIYFIQIFILMLAKTPPPCAPPHLRWTNCTHNIYWHPNNYFPTIYYIQISIPSKHLLYPKKNPIQIPILSKCSLYPYI